MLTATSKEERIKEAFEKFDLDGDGRLDNGELQEAVKRLGLELQQEEVEDMLIEADADFNGCISYKEFNNILLETNTLKGTGVADVNWEKVVNILFGEHGITPRIVTPNTPTQEELMTPSSAEFDVHQFLKNLENDDEDSISVPGHEEELTNADAPTLHVTGVDESDDVEKGHIEEMVELVKDDVEHESDPSQTTHIHQEEKDTNNSHIAPSESDPPDLSSSPSQLSTFSIPATKLEPIDTNPSPKKTHTRMHPALMRLPISSATPSSPLSLFGDTKSDEDIDHMLKRTHQSTSSLSSLDSLERVSNDDHSHRSTSPPQSNSIVSKSNISPAPRNQNTVHHIRAPLPTKATAPLPLRRAIHTSAGKSPHSRQSNPHRLSNPKPRPSTSGGPSLEFFPTVAAPKPAVPRFSFTTKSDEKPYYKRKEYIISYLPSRNSKSPEKLRKPIMDLDKPVKKVLEHRQKTKKRVREKMRLKKERERQLEQQEEKTKNNYQNFVSKIKRSRKRNRVSMISNHDDANGGKSRSPSPPGYRPSNKPAPIQYQHLSWQKVKKWSLPPPSANITLVNVEDRYIALVGSESLKGMYFFKDNRWFAVKTGPLTPQKGCSVVYYDALQALVLHGTMNLSSSNDSGTQQQLKQQEKRHQKLSQEVSALKNNQSKLQHTLTEEQQIIDEAKRDIQLLETDLKSSKSEIIELEQKRSSLQDQNTELQDKYQQFSDKIDARIEKKFYKDSETIFQLESKLKQIEIEEFAPIRMGYEQLQHSFTTLSHERDCIYDALMQLDQGTAPSENGQIVHDEDMISAVMFNNSMSTNEKRIFLEKQLLVKDVQLEELEETLKTSDLAQQFTKYQQKIKSLRREIVISQTSLHSFTKIYEQQKEEKEQGIRIQREALEKEICEVDAIIGQSKASRLLRTIGKKTTLIEDSHQRMNEVEEEMQSNASRIEDILTVLAEQEDKIRELERRSMSSDGAVWLYLFQSGKWELMDRGGGGVGGYQEPNGKGGSGSTSSTHPPPTRYHSAVLCKSTDSMIVFGGLHRKTASNIVRRFSFARSEWQVEAHQQDRTSLDKGVPSSESDTNPQHVLPSPRYHHTAQMVSTDMIVYGGTDGKRGFNDVWRYQTHTSRWIQLNILGEAPDPCLAPITSTVRGHEIFIWSGDMLHILNLQLMRWTPPLLDQTVSPRDAVGLCFFRGNIIMFGGKDRSSSIPCNDMFELNLKMSGRREMSTRHVSPEKGALIQGVNLEHKRSRSPQKNKKPDFRFEAYRPNANLYDLSLFTQQSVGRVLPPFRGIHSGVGGVSTDGLGHASSSGDVDDSANPYTSLPAFGRKNRNRGMGYF